MPSIASSVDFINATKSSTHEFWTSIISFFVTSNIQGKKEAILQLEKVNYCNTMIATDQQHYHNPSGNMDTIFDAEWETLSHISRTSRFSERINLSDDFQESVDHLKATSNRSITECLTTERDKSICLSSEWATSLGSDRLDLILSASSLTDGSCLSLPDESEDDDILSTVRFDEEAIESRDGISINDGDEGDEAVQSNCFSTKDNSRNKNTKMPANHAQEINGGGSISYAQLFFDPETKALVTLMEISNNLQPTRQHRSSSRRKNDTSNERCSRLERRQTHLHRKTPLHRSFELPSKRDTDNSFSNSAGTRDGRKRSNSAEGWSDVGTDDDSPFQDETLSTECSSLSSVTYRKNDGSHRGSDCGDDWFFSAAQLFPPAPVRFSDEPVVFSNDGSMEQRLCWLDEADVGLYLLEDCADPWDNYGSNRGGARCGESIKRLLSASKLCIPLTQLGESKWRAHHRASSLSNGGHHKPKLSYSILNDF